MLSLRRLLCMPSSHRVLPVAIPCWPGCQEPSLTGYNVCWMPQPVSSVILGSSTEAWHICSCHVRVRQRARVVQWRSRASRSSTWVFFVCVAVAVLGQSTCFWTFLVVQYRRGVVSHVWVIRWWYCWSVVVMLLPSARLCGKSAIVCDSDVLCVECTEYSMESITLYVVCVCLVLSIFVCFFIIYT